MTPAGTVVGGDVGVREPARALSERLPYLDGWRGIAIALVLHAHFLKLIPLETGRLGVDVFFCLSGFLMSGLLFFERQPLGHFYKRRISRILPAFVLFVVAMYVFAFLKHLPFTGTEVVATFLFLRTYIPADPGIWAAAVPIGHLWSLNIEEHSYMLMSALVFVRAFKGREGAVLLAAGISCIGIGYWYARLRSAAAHWGELGTEVAASTLMISAGYRLVRERFSITLPGALPLVAIVLTPFCYARVAPWWASSFISPFLLAFAVNHLAQTPLWFKSALSNRPLRYLGTWSFSIYLWQQPFNTYQTSFPAGGLGALACAIALALLCFYFLEKPSRTWLNRNW